MAELYDAILNGNATAAAESAREALAGGAGALELVQGQMVPAMDEVGRRFECEDYFVPELLLAARAMKAALAPIRPLLAASGAQPAGRVVIGAVKGDLHDIGKNIVAAMLEGGGFEVVDLGADVPEARFVEAVRANHADLVCLSALLTVTMPAMKRTIEALEAAGLRRQAKVLVGGAPVTQRFADEIGADGYGENAAVAVALARKMAAPRESA
ncbi:MAG: corrinoid protein [Bryobacteraceae bacterium]|jgi:corrinoid protein of di/trimethylamine methyltransferase